MLSFPACDLFTGLTLLLGSLRRLVVPEREVEVVNSLQRKLPHCATTVFALFFICCSLLFVVTHFPTFLSLPSPFFIPFYLSLIFFSYQNLDLRSLMLFPPFCSAHLMHLKNRNFVPISFCLSRYKSVLRMEAFFVHVFVCWEWCLSAWYCADKHFRNMEMHGSLILSLYETCLLLSEYVDEKLKSGCVNPV